MFPAIGVLLTQWKRQNLADQLKYIIQQTITIDFIIIFQNEHHVDIKGVINDFRNKTDIKILHVLSDYNTKFFGRFTYFFNIPVDICIVMDDDIIPGKNCIKNYVNQCIDKNAIIGGNGRLGYSNTHKNLKKVLDVGLRPSLLMDFVGHLWCFKKDWLYFMFREKPYTFDTGEDMHLCYSCKLFGSIPSYVAHHYEADDCSDLAMNNLAVDKHSSFKTVNKRIRPEIENYWISKGLKLIDSN